jgi:hypothetical protein
MPRTEEQLLEIVYARSAHLSRRRRVAITLAAVTAVACAAIVPYVLLRDVSSVGRVVNPIAPPRQQATPTAAPREDNAPASTPRAKSGQAESPTTDEREQQQPGRETVPGDEAADCSPAITDPSGDATDPQLDVLNSTIAFNDDMLVVTHRIRDLTGVYSSGERREWDFVFTWAGRRYTLRAAHESSPTQAAETFEIFRRRHNSGSGLGENATIARMVGSIDSDTDLITVEMPLTDFNDGEAEQSRAEQRDPPSPMAKGSRLVDLDMQTRSTKLATDGGDDAAGRCSYELRS